MLKTKLSRRGLLGAGLLTLAAVIWGAGFGSAGDVPSNDSKEPAEPGAPVALVQPANAPLDKPVVRFHPQGWDEIQDPILVHFSPITKLNKSLSAEVSLKNRGDKPVKGPIRIVLDEIRILGLTLKNGSGKLSNGAPFIEILAKGKTLQPDKITTVRKMTLELKREPLVGELQQFSPDYRVLVPASKTAQNATADANGNGNANGTANGGQLATPPGGGMPGAFSQQDLDKTMKSQNSLSDKLMDGNHPDIYGTGTSIDENGNLYISVFSRIPNPADVPAQMDGLPVRVELKGPFFPQGDDVKMKLEPIPQDAQAQAGLYTDNIFARPVPMGVGIGNEGACGWVGTLGGRTRGSGGTYLMSNYHVLTPQTGTITAVRITQPATCSNVANYRVGTLSLYYPITFSTTASNRYDAAWAISSTSLVSTRVPSGFGSLGSVTAPVVGQYVQKYGRTTQYTKGYITSINITSNINYSRGTARFVGLVMISPQAGYSAFSAGGDSGSLIVKQGTNQPVALLFAGSGATTLACPLPGLLQGAGMTLDTN